jgi:hypothetical protein
MSFHVVDSHLERSLAERWVPRSHASSIWGTPPCIASCKLEPAVQHLYGLECDQRSLNLIAGFDTRSGEVIGICRKRKRQIEFIELLEEIDRRTPAEITLIHLVCDNVTTHKGKLTRAWLARHPRFRMHFTPVHCSWMNQIEQWFSILQRKRLAVANFADLADLAERITAFIDEWNIAAHPFKWSRDSVTKILAKVDAAIAAAAAPVAHLEAAA